MMKQVIDYLLNDDLAFAKKRKKRIEINSHRQQEIQIQQRQTHTVPNVLTKKLLSIKKTNEYRSYALNKVKDALSEGNVKNLLTKDAIQNTFKVRDIQSACRRYANSIVLENKHFEGERG